MCDKCKDIDTRIARFSRLAKLINDQPTIERFNAAIRNLESEKLALHEPPLTC